MLLISQNVAEGHLRPAHDILRNSRICIRNTAESATAFNENKEHAQKHHAGSRRADLGLSALVNASTNVVCRICRMGLDWGEMRQLDGRGCIVDADSTTDVSLGEYIHPNDQPQVLTAIEEAIRTKSVFELEHRVRRVDGTLGWILARQGAKSVLLVEDNDDLREPLAQLFRLDGWSVKTAVDGVDGLRLLGGDSPDVLHDADDRWVRDDEPSRQRPQNL